jgi:hypothetical protein
MMALERGVPWLFKDEISLELAETLDCGEVDVFWGDGSRKV